MIDQTVMCVIMSQHLGDSEVQYLPHDRYLPLLNVLMVIAIYGLKCYIIFNLFVKSLLLTIVSSFLMFLHACSL